MFFVVILLFFQCPGKLKHKSLEMIVHEYLVRLMLPDEISLRKRQRWFCNMFRVGLHDLSTRYGLCLSTRSREVFITKGGSHVVLKAFCLIRFRRVLVLS